VRSLRGRLTLGVLVVLAAVLAVGGVLALREVRHSERAAFDDRLERTAELSRSTALAAVQQELPGPDRRLDDVLRASASSVRVRVQHRILLEAGAPLPSLPPLRHGLQTFSAGGQRYRAYATTFGQDELGGLARLEVVSSLQSLDERQAALNRRLVLLGVLALVVCGVGVWLAAGAVLRPLRRLRTVAAGVAADEDLDRRVPDTGGAVELRSLARSFNAMLARLGRSAADRERALAATRRFAADAGHELRTPLTSVQATLSTLRRHPELDPQRRGELVGDALAEQARLVALLDGLQALARGDAGPLQRTAVDLAELVDMVVTDAGARHPQACVDLELPDGPVVVSGWEPGLRMLVDNLVRNATVHGGGAVAVAVRDDGPGGVVLRVDDDGPGVAAVDRERIFTPFVRLEGTRAPGSGLGLALVAQQAGHHGAAVEIGASPLGGARFTVRFPAADRQLSSVARS